MTLKLHESIQVEGIYSFKAINSLTNEERDLSAFIADDHPNLFLNSGLEALGTASDLAFGCRVGSGSSAVVATQTALDSTVASTTTVQSSSAGAQSSPPYFNWGRRTYRFAQGVATGNLTEVGVYSNISGNPLISRALILDSSGNPTTLTILADEYLDVTYELRCYVDTTDKNLELVLLGETYNVVARPSNITYSSAWADYFFTYMTHYWTTTSTFYNGPIGAITGTPSGSGANLNFTRMTYISGSYEQGLIHSAGLDFANLSGGVSALRLRTSKGEWQLGFTPPIPKDNFKTLVINVYLSWARQP